MALYYYIIIGALYYTIIGPIGNREKFHQIEAFQFEGISHWWSMCTTKEKSSLRYTRREKRQGWKFWRSNNKNLIHIPSLMLVPLVFLIDLNMNLRSACTKYDSKSFIIRPLVKEERPQLRNLLLLRRGWKSLQYIVGIRRSRVTNHTCRNMKSIWMREYARDLSLFSEANFNEKPLPVRFIVVKFYTSLI